MKSFDELDVTLCGEAGIRLRNWIASDIPGYEWRVSPIVLSPTDFRPQRGIMVRRNANHEWVKLKTVWSPEQNDSVHLTVFQAVECEVAQYKDFIEAIKRELTENPLCQP